MKWKLVLYQRKGKNYSSTVTENAVDHYRRKYLSGSVGQISLMYDGMEGLGDAFS